MLPTSQETFHRTISSLSIAPYPPGFSVHPYLYYWQTDQSPRFVLCLLCNALHIAEPVVNNGSLSLVVHNIPLTNRSSDWPLDNTAPLYTNFHPVAVHKLCAALPKSNATECFPTPYFCQLGQLSTPYPSFSMAPYFLQHCSTSIPTTQQGFPNMNFTIPLPPPAMSNIAPPPSKLIPENHTFTSILSEEVPLNPDSSSLDSTVQEVILATSLRHLQQNFSLPHPSHPPTTISHNTSSPPSPSPLLTPGPTTPQQSEWGTPHLLLDPPTSPTSSPPAIAQPLPPAPPRAVKPAKPPLAVGSSQPLHISGPAWRRVSRWVVAIETFLGMQQSGNKPEPAMAQRSSREMVEAIKEVHEEKGLMSCDIILGTELYRTVRRLADANVNGRKNQPSNLAKGVLECWAGRFPGMLPEEEDDDDADVGMDVDE